MLHIKISNARAEIYISQPTKLVEKNTVLQLELECIMQSWAIKWVRGLKDAMNQPNLHKEEEELHLEAYFSFSLSPFNSFVAHQ